MREAAQFTGTSQRAKKNVSGGKPACGVVPPLTFCISRMSEMLVPPQTRAKGEAGA